MIPPLEKWTPIRIKSRKWVSTISTANCPETEEVCACLQHLAFRLGTIGKHYHDLNIAATP